MLCSMSLSCFAASSLAALQEKRVECVTEGESTGGGCHVPVLFTHFRRHFVVVVWTGGLVVDPLDLFLEFLLTPVHLIDLLLQVGYYLFGEDRTALLRSHLLLVLSGHGEEGQKDARATVQNTHCATLEQKTQNRNERES